MSPSFALNRVVFYGRSLREYSALYGLDIKKLAGLRLLDCAAGTASVTAELMAHGIDAMACDPRYGQTEDKLARIAAEDIAHVMERLRATANDFNWDFYGDIDGRRVEAEKSGALFIAHFRKEPKRYIAAALPKLPFDDNTFDRVICGHFLFLYEDRFPPGFTDAAINELIRVCRGEIHIYPLHQMGEEAEGDRTGIATSLVRRGINATLHPAGLQFKKGAESFMTIKC